MLVLTRSPGEAVVLDGRIEVQIVSVKGRRVRLAFNAPAEVAIRRVQSACRSSENGGEPIEPRHLAVRAS